MWPLWWICSSQKSVFRGKTCNACRKIGDFDSVCRSKPCTMDSVEIDEISSEEYEYVYSANHQEYRKPPICQLQIKGKSVEIMIHSVAPVNLLDEITFARITVRATNV